MKKFIVLSVGIVGLVPLLQQEVIQANNTVQKVQNVRQQKSDPTKNLETHQQIAPISDTHITARFIDEAGQEVHPTINVPVRDMGSVLKYDIGSEFLPHFKGYELQNGSDVSDIVTDPNQVITLRYKKENDAKSVTDQKSGQHLPVSNQLSQRTNQLEKSFGKVIVQQPLSQPNSDSKQTIMQKTVAESVTITNSQSQSPVIPQSQVKGPDTIKEDHQKSTKPSPTLLPKSKADDAASQLSLASAVTQKTDPVLHATEAQKAHSTTLQTNKNMTDQSKKISQKSHEDDADIQSRVRNQVESNHDLKETKSDTSRSSSVNEQKISKNLISEPNQTKHDSMFDGNKSRIVSQPTGVDGVNRRETNLSKKDSKLRQKRITVHMQGVNNDGRRLFDKNVKVLSTNLSHFTHKDNEFYGYDLDTQDYDSKTNILTLHYHPRKLTLKIFNIDENGEIISSRDVQADYGTELVITPQKIDGYRAVDQTKSIQIDHLLMPDIYVSYHKEVISPRSADHPQSQLTNPEQKPSGVISRAKESTPSVAIPMSDTKDTQKTDSTKQRKANKGRSGKRGKSKLVHSKKRPKKQAKRDKLSKQRRKTGRNSRKSFVKNSNRRQKRTNQKQLPQTGESHSKQTLLFGWLLLVGLACQKSFKWLH